MIKLKENVLEETLYERGFKAVITPEKTFVLGQFTDDDDDQIIIDIETRTAKWRYQHNEKPIQQGLRPVIDLFEIPEDKNKKLNLKNINDLAKDIHQNAIDHGWWDDERTLGDIIALIHTELSESFEEFRNGKPMIYEGKKGKPEGIATEMVDAVIRIFDYLAKEDIDIEDLIIKKHLYNKTRSYKHGNKKI